MLDELADIRDGIQEGKFVTAPAVEMGVVLRLLHALNWPILNPAIV